MWKFFNEYIANFKFYMNIFPILDIEYKNEIYFHTLCWLILWRIIMSLRELLYLKIL
jgi:hypothetical protein